MSGCALSPDSLIRTFPCHTGVERPVLLDLLMMTLLLPLWVLSDSWSLLAELPDRVAVALPDQLQRLVQGHPSGRVRAAGADRAVDAAARAQGPIVVGVVELGRLDVGGESTVALLLVHGRSPVVVGVIGQPVRAGRRAGAVPRPP